MGPMHPGPAPLTSSSALHELPKALETLLLFVSTWLTWDRVWPSLLCGNSLEKAFLDCLTLFSANVAVTVGLLVQAGIL